MNKETDFEEEANMLMTKLGSIKKKIYMYKLMEKEIVNRLNDIVEKILDENKIIDDLLEEDDETTIA